MSKFQTGHVGLNVPDVARALPFYAGVFGWDVLRESADPEKRFAFLGDGDTDPDGIRLEIYAGAGAHDHGPAPAGDAPTCGFF